MDQLINQLAEKCGLDKEQAGRVAQFLKDNSDKIPEWLGSAGMGGIADKAKGMLGGLGGKD